MRMQRLMAVCRTEEFSHDMAQMMKSEIML